MSRSIPILMYHQVTPQPLPTFRKYVVLPEAFTVQMKWLALMGYSTITLDRLLEHRNGRASLPRRPVIITFDDGFRDCVEHAVPVLQAYGFTAIFYLVAGLVGKTSGWLRHSLGLDLPLLDWAAARRLEMEGHACGAHSMTHPHLADLSAAACRDELREARRVLEYQLGHEVRHMAYPYGSFNEMVRMMSAETGYCSACSVQSGLSSAGDDPLALHRVPVTGQDSLLDFICRLRTSWPMRDLLHSKAQFLRGRFRQAGR